MPPNDNIPLADEFPHAPPPEPGSHPVNVLFDRIFTVVFMLALLIPLIAAGRNWDAGSKSENRQLAPFPAAPHDYRSLANYSDEFFDYFKDHFGFRNTLILHFQDFRFRAGLLPNNDQVLIGKPAPWLFLSHRKDLGYLRERGLKQFTEEELDAWQTFFEKRQAYLNSRGIAYVAFFAPDKQTIYPEHMPDDLVTPFPSRLDQLQERLRKTHSPVTLVDVRPALLAAKKDRLLYFKTDTHWNGYGAFVAYQIFLQAAQQKLPQYTLTPQTLNDFNHASSPNYSGDLVGLLGLANQLSEDHPIIGRKIPLTKIEQGQDKNQPWARYENRLPAGTHGAATAPSLCLFHDSFGNFLPDMIVPHFQHAYVRFIDSIEIPPINREQPTLVITQLVERKLYLEHPPVDPPEIANFVLQNRIRSVSEGHSASR